MSDTAAPLDRSAIVELIRSQLAEILEKSPDEIKNDQPFVDQGADSLALIELVEALEEHYATYAAGFHIDDEDLEALVTVDDAASYVATKLQVA